MYLRDLQAGGAEQGICSSADWSKVLDKLVGNLMGATSLSRIPCLTQSCAVLAVLCSQQQQSGAALAPVLMFMVCSPKHTKSGSKTCALYTAVHYTWFYNSRALLHAVTSQAIFVMQCTCCNVFITSCILNLNTQHTMFETAVGTLRPSCVEWQGCNNCAGPWQAQAWTGS